MACCTLFLFVLSPQEARAQVTVDATTNAVGSAVNTLTWSHTVGAGSNRILLVGVSNRNGGTTVTGVTYGGTALAQAFAVTGGNGGSRAEMWGMLAPPTGTANVVVTMSGGSRDLVGGAISFFGVDQLVPVGTVNTATNTSLTASVTIASAPGELVLDVVAANGPATSLTAGALQTSRWNNNTGVGANDERGAGSTEPGAASVTMSWTLGASSPWSIGALTLRPAPLGGISGTVFEDLNYGGGAGRSLVSSAGSVRANARVELYNAAGLFLSATTTNASGVYSFNTLVPGNYTVRVVNSTVTSSRTGYVATLVPVQTFRTNASTGAAVADTIRVGGEDPTRIDAASNLTNATLASLTTATLTPQSITPATVGVVVIGGVDFGYNFDTIVSTRDAGQGSLRQFIINSNALGNGGLAQVGQTAGVEATIFMVSDSLAHPGLRAGLTNQLTAGVANITPLSLLPAITAASIAIDGTTQTTNVGNTNAGTLGVGGVVGVDSLSLSTVERPEVRIADASGILIGLDIQASNVTIRGLAIYGFGAAANTDGNANIRIGSNFTGTLIWQNVLGSTGTTFTDPGAATRSIGDNIRSQGADNGIVRNNLIGFSQGKGFGVEAVSTGWLIENNEIRGNGINNSNLDGIDIENASAGCTVSGNLILNNEGVGVDMYQSAGTNTVVNNTIISNGFGPGANVETSGVRLFGTGNIVDRNIVTANFGAGVMVTGTSTGNTITRNSIFANGVTTGQIGIDLLRTTDDLTRGTAPFVTQNDAADADTGGNGLRNFPIITSAILGSGNLTLSGFAQPGTIIELFIAAPDPSGFGEGQTYKATVIEGSASDTDAGTGTYTIAGVGTDTTNRFTFVIAAPSGVAVGTNLTTTGTVGGNTSEFSNNVPVVQATGGVRLGPLGQPNAIGPTNNYDDYTNQGANGGIAGVAPGGVTTAGSIIIFTNTVQNTGNAADTFVLTAPTAPAGSTVEISINGGVSYTPVQPGNGSVGFPVAFGASANFLVRVTLPFPLPVLSPYPTVIRATSTNTPATFNESIDRAYTGYVRLVKAATVSNATGVGGATDPVPGAVITYTVTYTNITSTGGTNNALLNATNLVITENGAAPNNWGVTTNHLIGATDTNGGTITGDVAGSTVLTVTIATLTPGQFGVFTFKRTIR